MRRKPITVRVKENQVKKLGFEVIWIKIDRIKENKVSKIKGSNIFLSLFI